MSLVVIYVHVLPQIGLIHLVVLFMKISYLYYMLLYVFFNHFIEAGFVHPSYRNTLNQWWYRDFTS